MKQVFYFWLRPIQTIEAIEQEEPGKVRNQINTIFILISIYGCLLYPKITTEIPKGYEYIQEYAYIILLAFFMFFVFKYVITFLFWSLSKILQGKSTIQQIRLVVAYSLSPNLALIPFAFIQFILTIRFHYASTDGTFFALFNFVFAILSFRYLVLGLSKVNKFTYGYGLLTALLVGTLFELIRFFR